VELHVVGGMFLDRQAALMGPRAIRALNQWSFDAAFLSGEAMDGQGISNSHASIAVFQKAVLRRARRSYFCLDATKLGRATPHRVTAWSGLTALITDAGAGQLRAHKILLSVKQHLPA
jgi:DeoR/GlpR family transcriptional regulator of sugar metabolism